MSPSHTISVLALQQQHHTAFHFVFISRHLQSPSLSPGELCSTIAATRSCCAAAIMGGDKASKFKYQLISLPLSFLPGFSILTTRAPEIVPRRKASSTVLPTLLGVLPAFRRLDYRHLRRFEATVAFQTRSKHCYCCDNQRKSTPATGDQPYLRTLWVVHTHL